jgi:aminoglycoside phosphotransferase (APT) family kinase protein
MHWAARACNGMLDWKSAGVGHPGADLGSLRMRAAFDFGPDAADEVTAAWEEVAGRRAEAIPYWDAIAALHTPYDEDTEARDAFLDDALHRLR